jgi:UDP-N-acetyl-D-galactosamine dehydrogenase
MSIDTDAVLKAAETKWNFLPFKPGLVGGHCIGVDPYYLTYKAQNIGYHPRVILAGRDLNDKMSNYVVSQFIKKMKQKFIKIKGSKILIMGLTFKENCPDMRNSGVIKIVKSLINLNCILDLYDPWVSLQDVKKIYKLRLQKKLISNKYDGIIIAVAHDKFRKIKIKNIKKLGKKNYVLFDLKNIFKTKESDFRL